MNWRISGKRTQRKHDSSRILADDVSYRRQRNARLELSNANANPEDLLAALHAERETAADEARRLADEEEDDAMVQQYFAKVGGPIETANGNGNGKAKAKGKGKGKAEEVDGLHKGKGRRNGDHADGDGNGDQAGSGDDDAGSEDEGEEDITLPSLTIKRRPAPGNGNGGIEPSVASILAAKGKVLDGAAANGAVNGNGAVPGQVKRNREGMQKLLGIKKKVKA